MSVNVLVVDLGIGNIRSLTAALAYLGANHAVSTNPAALKSATHVILPGVGAYDAAMQKMRELSLTEALQEYGVVGGRPLLGVCLGMQLLFERSDEGELPGLGMLPGRFRMLAADPAAGHKVPHVGFATTYGYEQVGLFAEIGLTADFYFTHSYALHSLQAASNTALCDHTAPFIAAVQQGNLCGVQFHPEKSQSTGLQLLSNFLELS